MKRVTVFFTNEDWATVETDYEYPNEVCKALNSTHPDTFINISGIICKAADVSKVLVEEMPEKEEGGEKD